MSIKYKECTRGIIIEVIIFTTYLIELFHLLLTSYFHTFILCFLNHYTQTCINNETFLSLLYNQFAIHILIQWSLTSQIYILLFSPKKHVDVLLVITCWLNPIWYIHHISNIHTHKKSKWCEVLNNRPKIFISLITL